MVPSDVMKKLWVRKTIMAHFSEKNMGFKEKHTKLINKTDKAELFKLVYIFLHIFANAAVFHWGVKVSLQSHPFYTCIPSGWIKDSQQLHIPLTVINISDAIPKLI